MTKFHTFARMAILALALVGLATGAVAVTHGPSLSPSHTVADSSSGTIDVG